MFFRWRETDLYWHFQIFKFENEQPKNGAYQDARRKVLNLFRWQQMICIGILKSSNLKMNSRRIGHAKMQRRKFECFFSGDKMIWIGKI
jgi:hypothetical protein